MPANLSRFTGSDSLPEFFGVAFRRIGSDGFHSAIAYRASGGSLHLLHLAGHRELWDDPETIARLQSYVCIEPNLTRAESISLAGYCLRIHKINFGRNNIPFSLQYDDGIGFDPDTGEIVKATGLSGMTCATFVLHVFHSTGKLLLDTAACPPNRPGDDERRLALADSVRASSSPDAQQQADYILQNRRGIPRIRPEEVAGACLEEALPTSYPQVESNGRLVLAVWDSWRSGKVH